MSKFVAGHVTKMWFSKLWIASFWTQILHFNFNFNFNFNVVTFTALLSVTIKRLTRYKQKVVFAALLEGKSIPSNMVASTNDTTMLKNQSTIKCLPYMRFLSNFGCKIIFMCSVKISTHCLKEAWLCDQVQVAYSAN